MRAGTLIATIAGLAICGSAYAQVLYGPAAIHGGTIDGATITNSTISGGVSSNNSVTSTGSTTARTLADRAADVVNVKDYGVVCDGTTDNAAAFGLVTTAAASGGVIYFPPAASACLTSAALVLPSNVVVRAEPGTVILKPTAASTASPVLFSVSGKANVTIYGLTLDGVSQDFGTVNNIFQAFNSTNVVLDHVTGQNMRGIAAVFSNTQSSGVKDSVFKNIGNHWKTTSVATDRQQAVTFCCTGTLSPTKNFATNSYYSDIGLDAISATNQADFVANGNRFSLANNQINLVTATAYAACIYVANNIESTANNNVCDGASGNGIDFFTITHAVVAGNYVTTSGAAGISIATVTNGTVVGNSTINNVQWASSAPKGGISFGNANGAITMAGNLSTDTQGTKTQLYGVHGYSSSTFSSLWIDQSNNLSGNFTAAAGGSNVLGYTIFRNGVIAQAPDSTTTGGNARGTGATDLQTSRVNANQVASGNNSTIGGGSGNQAAGQYGTVAGGTSSFASGFASYAVGQTAVATGSYGFASGFTTTADGQYSVARGGQVATRGRWGADCYGTGFLAVQGDAQICQHVMRGTGASTTAIRLNTSGGALNSASCISIPDSSAYSLVVNIMALDHTTVSKNETWAAWTGLLTRGAGVGTTALTMATTPTPISNGTVTGSAIAATPDTTNGCLNISFTPPTANTDTWNVVARVETVEVQ